MIKVVICDGNGTIGLPSPTDPFRNLLDQMSSLKMQLAVASNESRSSLEKVFSKASLPCPKLMLTPTEIKKPKPAPEYVYQIKDLAGVNLSEITYLGDNDDTDIFCAINAKILPLAAKYANPDLKYGLPFSTVEALQNYLEHFCQQTNPYFGWEFSSTCKDTGCPIEVYSLLGQHGTITGELTRVFKNQEQVRIGPKDSISLPHLLFYYFITQCFLSGLMQKVQLVTVYPGHQKGMKNHYLEKFSELVPRSSKDRYLNDLIIRHEDAFQSRLQGDKRKIFEQIRTIRLNEKYKTRIEGKTILVLDDFTTSGFSLETARRMLLQGGAKHVVGLAIGKFRTTYSVTTISKEWDPYEKSTLKEKEVKVSNQQGNLLPAADRSFYGQIYEFFKKTGLPYT